MINSIMKILRLMLKQQIELSKQIDDLYNVNLPVHYHTPLDRPLIGLISGELEVLESMSEEFLEIIENNSATQ